MTGIVTPVRTFFVSEDRETIEGMVREAVGECHPEGIAMIEVEAEGLEHPVSISVNHIVCLTIR